jgi:hypothetical protein
MPSNEPFGKPEWFWKLNPWQQYPYVVEKALGELCEKAQLSFRSRLFRERQPELAEVFSSPGKQGGAVEDHELGTDCPRLERELFRALRAERGPLKEWELIAILWGYSPDLEKHKRHLATLKAQLNRRLAKLKLPYKVVRLWRGEFQLADPATPDNAPPNLCTWEEYWRGCEPLFQLAPEMRLDPLFRERMHESWLPHADWPAELRQELANGPVESSLLWDDFKRRGCPRNAYDRAMKEIGAKSKKQGYGSNAKLFIFLSADASVVAK